MQKLIYRLDWIRLSLSQETQRRMIEIVWMSKTRTHAHTHTHTHARTHTHTQTDTRKLINITVEKVSIDENIWHPSFFQNNPLTNPSLFWGKSWPTLFLENVTKTQPLPPIYKGGGSNYGSRIKMSKNNAISKKSLLFQRPQITQ